MTARTFPYTAWMLSDAYVPVELTITHKSSGDWVRASNGKLYDSTKLHSVRAAAIDAGHLALDAQRRRLNKAMENLELRRENLLMAARSA